jgi:hypothetical protein
MLMPQAEREALVAERVAAHDPVTQEFHTVPWREAEGRFPVIDLELDATVLSPYSHRIRAQLESAENAELIEAEPFSEAAQEAIAGILREVGENFEELKQNLADDGQQQFGVVTRSGLLVNANRRAVALRDLGKTYIKVAVLPADTTMAEIDDLELTLQMRRNYWEAYTFTNRLLFVEDLINNQGRSESDVARALDPAVVRDDKALKKGVERVEGDTRVLAMLRRIQERAGEGRRIPLTEFDAQEVAIEELERKVHDTQAENPDAARDLFEVRLLGILSEVVYRRLRYLDGDVLEEYVIPTLADNPLFSDVIPVLGESGGEVEPAPVVEPEGLDVLGDEPAPASGASGAGRQVSALVDLLVSSYGEDRLTLPSTEGPRSEEREVVRAGLKRALTDAADDVELDRRRDNRLLRPARLAEDAERKLRAAREAFESVKGSGGFDRDAFVVALEQVAKRLDALRSEADPAD